MSVFLDYADLRVAVMDSVKDTTAIDVMDRMVEQAEVGFNRRLRCRQQITETTGTAASGVLALPAGYVELIGVYDAQGYEYLAQPLQELRTVQQRGYFGISAAGIIVPVDEALTVQYYAPIPTITATAGGTNWLLLAHPMLYLYGTVLECAKHLRDAELASATAQLLEGEYMAVHEIDQRQRYARGRVRVAGVTP